MKLRQFGSFLAAIKVACKTLIANGPLFSFIAFHLVSYYRRILLHPEFLADRFRFEPSGIFKCYTLFHTELWRHKSATLTLIGIGRKFADLIHTFSHPWMSDFTAHI